ncbi:MAG: hypothetical protein ACYS22_10270 [Planctomycetota bacterium]
MQDTHRSRIQSGLQSGLQGLEQGLQDTHRTSEWRPILASLGLGLLLLLPGCVTGDVAATAEIQGRLCFDQPLIPLQVDVSDSFLVTDDDAPAALGPVLARGTKNILRASAVFAKVTGPEPPVDGSFSGAIAPPRAPAERPETPAAKVLGHLVIEGEVLAFDLFQDYRWILIYGAIAAIPVVGVSVISLGLFLAGLPVFTDRCAIEIELRVRDTRTSEIVGVYRGSAEEGHHHNLYNAADFQPSFWGRPELVFARALREALRELIADSERYRALAAP